MERAIRDAVAAGDYEGAGKALEAYSAYVTDLVRGRQLEKKSADLVASQFRELSSWILLMTRCNVAQIREKLAREQSKGRYPTAARRFPKFDFEG
jgi:hypothetical protein